MTDDYLWDRSGEPDPEIHRLENVLGSLRSQRPLRHLNVPPGRTPKEALGTPLQALAAAATLVLALSALWRASLPRTPAWEYTLLRGPAWSGAVVSGRDRLEVGGSLETGPASRARMKVGLIGLVDVEPLTRVRLLEAGRRIHRLSLERGVMHARIWAPPRMFFVDTPSAVAVDLGCSYTLQVDDAGAGLLRVESGWVGFEFAGRESFVPTGALCATRPGVGPGTPYYEDAPHAFRAALETVDFTSDAVARTEALQILLREARQRDALSLWHLLVRTDGAEREWVHDRMAVLIPPPEGVTREGVLKGEREMLDLWWRELDLGSANFWRLWKAPWPPRVR